MTQALLPSDTATVRFEHDDRPLVAQEWHLGAFRNHAGQVVTGKIDAVSEGSTIAFTIGPTHNLDYRVLFDLGTDCPFFFEEANDTSDPQPALTTLPPGDETPTFPPSDSGDLIIRPVSDSVPPMVEFRVTLFDDRGREIDLLRGHDVDQIRFFAQANFEGECVQSLEVSENVAAVRFTNPGHDFAARDPHPLRSRDLDRGRTVDGPTDAAAQSDSIEIQLPERADRSSTMTFHLGTRCPLTPAEIPTDGDGLPAWTPDGSSADEAVAINDLGLEFQTTVWDSNMQLVTGAFGVIDYADVWLFAETNDLGECVLRVEVPRSATTLQLSRRTSEFSVREPHPISYVNAESGLRVDETVAAEARANSIRFELSSDMDRQSPVAFHLGTSCPTTIEETTDKEAKFEAWSPLIRSDDSDVEGSSTAMSTTSMSSSIPDALSLADQSSEPGGGSSSTLVWFFGTVGSVSYTHLTLPTNREV